LPALNTDWWNYGGLTRSVRLVETPRVFVRAARVQLDHDDASLVRGFVRLDGARAPTPVTIEIPAARATHTVTTDGDGNARFEFAATLETWSPESPRLYDVVVRAADDRVSDRIVFRTRHARGADLR